MGLFSGPSPSQWRKEFNNLKADFDRIGGELSKLKGQNASEFGVLGDTSKTMFTTGANLLKNNPELSLADKTSILRGLGIISEKMKEMGFDYFSIGR